MAGNKDVNRRRAVGTRYGFDVAYLKARTPSPRRYTSHWHGWLPLSSPSGALCLQQVITLEKLEFHYYFRAAVPSALAKGTKYFGKADAEMMNNHEGMFIFCCFTYK